MDYILKLELCSSYKNEKTIFFPCSYNIAFQLSDPNNQKKLKNDCISILKEISGTELLVKQLIDKKLYHLVGVTVYEVNYLFPNKKD